jgi:Tol biopolymer transport system component
MATPGAKNIEELWAWSPNSARLALMRVDGEDDRLYVINPTDGSRILRLQNGGNRTAMEWSPDGTRIAVASEGEGIFEVEADPGGMTQLEPSFEHVADIDYSPEGRQIMVLDQGGRRLQVMNEYLGSDHHAIVEGQDICCAAWSPNADRILYQLSVENGTERPDLQVWTVAPDGSNPIEVFDSQGCALSAYSDAPPVWAPNGTQVAFKNCDNWAVANADGTGEPQPIDELQYRSWAGGGLSG